MTISILKKYLLPTLALTATNALLPETAAAATGVASFGADATVSYSISSLTNLTNPGALPVSDLQITGLAKLDDSQTYTVINGNAWVTPGFTGAQGSPTPSQSYTASFSVNGKALNGGELSANYGGLLSWEIGNTSATDTYAIDLKLAYELKASAEGDNAYTGINLSYANLDESWSSADFLDTTHENPAIAITQNTATYQFTLAPGISEKILLKANISGAAVAAPVPGAVWLFGSALMLLPGFKRLKTV